MTKKQKAVWKVSILAAAFLAVCPVASAMHIMEGYLPPAFCIAWGVLCIPFLVRGFFTLKNLYRENPKMITMIAMAGAYIFVLSALKIPSVTGSCSHMTGTGLAAILFGPCATGILGIIVLLFQAILLAHGGLTTLGANTFSMAIAGPLVTYGIYLLCKKCNVNRRFSVFLAAAAGDLFTYCVTSVQLAVAYPAQDGGVGASILEFLGVFAPTQLPLAVVEGLLTVMIIIALENYAGKELKALGFIKAE
ncbi:MAG: energy-coupling factor ABC transporter permease [Clostridiaceae bacterium]|nr:energy-coupling factor ABC transporter permease [Clostridiaceae bacterium]